MREECQDFILRTHFVAALLSQVNIGLSNMWIMGHDMSLEFHCVSAIFSRFKSKYFCLSFIFTKILLRDACPDWVWWLKALTSSSLQIPH